MHCEGNERDCNLILEFEKTNEQIREQKRLEQSKVVDARKLIKMLKQELIQAQKDRDTVRNEVYIQRKQLEKHSSNLRQQQMDKNNALLGLKADADDVITASVSKIAMMHRQSKEQDSKKLKFGEQIRIGNFSMSAQVSKLGSRLGSRKQS